MCGTDRYFLRLDSEKAREIAAAVETPPSDRFRFDDDSEFPPVTQKTE